MRKSKGLLWFAVVLILAGTLSYAMATQMPDPDPSALFIDSLNSQTDLDGSFAELASQATLAFNPIPHEESRCAVCGSESQKDAPLSLQPCDRHFLCPECSETAANIANHELAECGVHYRCEESVQENPRLHKSKGSFCEFYLCHMPLASHLRCEYCGKAQCNGQVHSDKSCIPAPPQQQPQPIQTTVPNP